MTAWQDDGMGWDLDVVEVPAGTLPGDRQVVAVLDADSRAGVYYVDTSAGHVGLADPGLGQHLADALHGVPGEGRGGVLVAAGADSRAVAEDGLDGDDVLAGLE